MKLRTLGGLGIVGVVYSQGDLDIDFDHTDIADAEHELLFGTSGLPDYSDIQADVNLDFQDSVVLGKPDPNEEKYGWLEGFESRSAETPYNPFASLKPSNNLQIDFSQIERTPEEMALLARRRKKKKKT